MLERNIFLAMLFVLLWAVPFASAADNACSSSGYLIVHINGINTTKKDARRNTFRALGPAIGASYNGEQAKVVLAYNPTKNVLLDLADVFRQKLGEYPHVSSELIFKALVSGIFGSDIPGPLRDFVMNYHIGKIKDSGFVGYDDNDLRDIVGAVRANAIEGQKILLVPHSQGNLYANAAYNVLTSGENAIPVSAIKIVGIASPATYVAGDGDYVTSTNDRVISSLRSLGFSVLASNFTIRVADSDNLGHNLSDIYLNADLEGRAEVLRKIHVALESLYFPGGRASQGPITVTLTWGSEPDVDLHILEPGGNHVYYANREGAAGYLDLDDTSAYGPEHYFTDCANVVTGTYVIAVNYYRGSAGETATVTIATPVNIITRTVNLPQALGSSGDVSPIQVATVTVRQTAQGRYSYSIN